MTDIVDDAHKYDANEIKKSMAVYDDAQDLINIGAYKAGSNPDIDAAIKHIKPINEFLQQEVDDGSPFDLTLEKMMSI
jgi:flagellum-specific ATP synthase